MPPDARRTVPPPHAADRPRADDRTFRQEVAIEPERYDDDLLSQMPLRSTDTAPPQCWRYADPVAAIARGEPVAYLLVDLRHWRAAPIVRARGDVKRLWKGLARHR